MSSYCPIQPGMLTCLLTSSLVFALSWAAPSLLCRRNFHERSIPTFAHQ